jgi:hypothetical protein
MTAVKLFKYGKGARIWKLFYQNSLKEYVKTRWRSIGTMLQSFVDAQNIYSDALKMLKNNTNSNKIKEKINQVSFSLRQWNTFKELLCVMKMIDNVSLYFSSSKRFISEIIPFMYRLSIQLYNIWKTPTTHLNTKTFIEKFCKDLSERMKHVNPLIWKAMLLNPNCLSIFDSCISQGWTTKIDLELYVLEIEESLKSFKVFKNDYEKFIQSKRMSHHQSSTFFENIDQIIGLNDFFNLENEIPHDE